MESKSKYFLEKNFIIYLLGKIISSMFTFASIPIFIKYFGISEYGKFSLLYTTFLMFLGGATGWIIQGVLRYYSLENDKEAFSREVTGMTIKTSLIVSIILLIVFLYNNSSILTVVIAVPTFVLACLYSVSTAILQSKFNSKKVILSDVFRLFLYFVIPIVLHFLNLKMLSEQILFLGLFCSYFFAVLIVIEWKLPIYLKLHNKKWSRKIWIYGFPLGIWLFLSPSLNTSDRYIINYFLGTIVVGQYSAVYDIIFRLFSQLTGPFYNVVQPLLINTYNSGNESEFKKILTKSGLYLTAMFLCLFGIVFFFKEKIIYNYLGFNGEVSINLSKIIVPLLLSSFIWQISILFQKPLEIQNRTILLAVYMLLSSIIGIVISIFLVPKFGFVFSAYSMLITSFVYLLLIIFTNYYEFISRKKRLIFQ